MLPYVDRLKESLSLHDVTHEFNSDELDSGDLLVLLSCEKIISDEVISKFGKSIVVIQVNFQKAKDGRRWHGKYLKASILFTLAYSKLLHQLIQEIYTLLTVSP